MVEVAEISGVGLAFPQKGTEAFVAGAFFAMQAFAEQAVRGPFVWGVLYGVGDSVGN
ncbi:hypothetical protein RMSM_01236 [Rhodopirellula maiorica SM1]|uniref:Uncharacterized protein n=1 Tax=Rhodopirellula maiorica SM1 TaxID=1265738 RepID=M5RRM8_9BACT|nr:hypothetical protein RMSM_01236 [Rhodopirellula maiorica SM1]